MSNKVSLSKVRELGQCWTPQWVAEAMVRYMGDGTVFDPAFGMGAFLEASNNAALGHKFLATEIDKELVTAVADKFGIEVECDDFLFHEPKERYPNIVANPPYVRHHRLSESQKQRARDICRDVMGFAIDGRAGLHVYFLVKCLSHLADNGKLAFIVPADVCEGIFADKLWRWVTDHYCLEAVVTFDSGASPFPELDINALVLFIADKDQTNTFKWGRIKSDLDDFAGFVSSGFQGGIEFVERSIEEGLHTGLSRFQAVVGQAGPTLGDFATINRGIATGANEFFFMTKEQLEDRKLPIEYFKRAIGRVRDLGNSDLITQKLLDDLDAAGRPTYLLSLDGTAKEKLPPILQDYIREGEKKQLHERVLIKTRTPWYKMEQRAVPSFFFAYLGRSNVRFIRNKAGALPLTSFLCVYPKVREDDLWVILNDKKVLVNLALVGKSYGSGAIKVEPRAMLKLPIPDDLAQTLTLKGVA